MTWIIDLSLDITAIYTASVVFDRLFAYPAHAANQYIKIYTIAKEGISCNLFSLAGSSGAQLISVVMKLVVVRVSSVIYVNVCIRLRGVNY